MPSESVFCHHALAIAKDVQRASFPRHPPEIPGVTCRTVYRPAQSVGGDYYDFLQLADGRWGIAIGDVSGKGVGAALVMASLQASLRTQALHTKQPIEAIMANLNETICEFAPEQFFASLFYGEYQPATRILNYVNAGHDAPIVVRRKRAEEEVMLLKATCVPIGAISGSKYTVTSFQFECGDVLVACTDGVTDSESVEGKLFGQDRLEHVLRRSRLDDPQHTLDDIIRELTSHSAGHSQMDDITILVMQVGTYGRETTT